MEQWGTALREHAFDGDCGIGRGPLLVDTGWQRGVAQRYSQLKQPRPPGAW